MRNDAAPPFTQPLRERGILFSEAGEEYGRNYRAIQPVYF
jgi:hypothetical protein